MSEVKDRIMPKRRKATNALKKRALKAFKEPVKGRRKTVKRKTRKAVKGAARAVKGAVKALATSTGPTGVTAKSIRSATAGLGTEAVAKILKDIKPGSPTAKKLLKLLNSAPTKGPVARTIRGRVTDKDIARKKKGKAKRGPAPKTKRRGLTRGSEYVAPDKSRVKKFKDRAKKRLKRRK